MRRKVEVWGRRWKYEEEGGGMKKNMEVWERRWRWGSTREV
jgi:hypothetical protein